MKTKQQIEIFKSVESFIGDILGVAEIGLEQHKFRQFKKIVFEKYHKKLKTQIVEVMSEDQNARQKNG